MNRTFIYILLLSNLNSQVVINEFMSSNSSIIYDEFGNTPDWIEIYNPNNIDLAGYGLSDNINEPFKFIFPNSSLATSEHVLIFASGEGQESIVQHWETVVDWGDEWNYFLGVTNPPTGWMHPDFDDSEWLSGVSGFGYGDNDDATIIPPYMSNFVRKSFDIESIDNIARIILHIDYDDAFVAYLNGIEIARSNIGTPGIAPNYNEGSYEWHEAVMYTGGYPEEYEIDFESNMLINEGNILAIQVHNYNQTSSDMSLIPFLTLGMLEEPSEPIGPSETLNFPMTNLHADFKIESEGETLILTNPVGEVIDLVDSVSVPTDVSFGRQSDGGSELVYFLEPTPNSANNTEGSNVFCEIPEFSHAEGFYTTPVEISLSSQTNTQQIYYTLDGSIPTENSIIYDGPIYIYETRVIRAAAVNSICPPEAVVTKSYLFDEISNLPTVSLTTDPYNLWDEEYGIYVMGNNASPAFPYFGANFWEDWERPIHVEFFEPTGNLGFSLNGGVKIFGNYSRGIPQKSLAIFARSEYGDSDIDYQIFPDKDIDSFKSFVLRNSGNEWFGDEGQQYATMFRDGMHTGLMDGTGIDHQAYRPAVVYINGEYWGIQNLREKVNEEFLASNNDGVDPDELDELEANGGIVEGDNQDYLDMITFVENNNMSFPVNYDFVNQQMDIENFIDYYIIQIFIGNTDWPGNNIKYWRPHTPDAKWKWILYDTDFGFGLFPDWSSNVYHNTLEFALNDNGPGWPNPPWSTLLFRKLMGNNVFQNKFINRFSYYYNTRFEPTYIENHISDISENIELEMDNHIDRWGGYIGTWNHNVNLMQSFGASRADLVKGHIGEYFSLYESSILNLSISPTDGGSISVSGIAISESEWAGEYFNNLPIEISSTPNPGYIFSHWEMDEDGYDEDIVITMDDDFNLMAVFVPIDSPGDLVSINEIMAINDTINIDEAEENDDWLELYNSGSEEMTIGGLYLSDNPENLSKWMIPLGTVIGPENFLLFWCDEDQEQGELHTNFKLNGEGESLFLVDFDGYSILDSISFGAQTADISYGRITDGYMNWRFFDIPTPGATNFDEGSLGDANQDGGLNILDVVIMVNYVLTGDDSFGELETICDINWDNVVNILDIVQLVNIILGNPRFEDATIAELSQDSDSFYVISDGYIGAIQMTISHDLDFNIELTDSSMVSEYRTIGNSTTLLIVQPLSDKIFTTKNNYVIDEIIVANSSDIIDVANPRSFTLGKPYPNPFNPITSIDFTLPIDSYVSIIVYDLLGREIISLVNQQYSSGFHTIKWDASIYSSGVYFVNMVSGNYTSTQKLMLVK